MPFVKNLPIDKFINHIKDSQTTEVWLYFAFFSKEVLNNLLGAINSRSQPLRCKLFISASSINPLHEVAEEIIRLKNQTAYFDIYLVEKKLMHAKFFVAKTEDRYYLYIGSANLTIQAEKNNIEAGYYFSRPIEKCQEIDGFLKKLSDECVKNANSDSTSALVSKAIFAHIREQIVFLALGDSKLVQSIIARPSSLKKYFSNKKVLRGEEFLNRTITESAGIQIITDPDRQNLELLEKNLRDAIKENLAIRLEEYGYVSSRWSISKALSHQATLNHYKSLKSCLEKLIEKYKTQANLEQVSLAIKNNLMKILAERQFDATKHKEALRAIEEYCERFVSDNEAKSPYRKFFKVSKKIVDGSDLSELFYPYAVGSDSELAGMTNEEDEDNDCFECLSADQVNLHVMCQLAIKLRSPTKRPPIPAVWWFDIALNEEAYYYLGYETRKSFNEDKADSLREIADDVVEGKKNLAACLTAFCEITGFSLDHPFPLFDNWGYPYKSPPESISGLYKSSIKVKNSDLQLKIKVPSRYLKPIKKPADGYRLGRDTSLSLDDKDILWLSLRHEK